MKRLFTAVANLLTAVAVAAPTANEDFVLAEDAQTYTNAVRAAKDYTDAAVAAATPADYANVSNRSMSAVQPADLAPYAKTDDLESYVKSNLGVNSVQAIGGTLAPDGLQLYKGWNRIIGKDTSTGVFLSLPKYIESNPWGFATLDAVTDALALKADKSAISATDPTFSNAVLAVGLNIDTKSVAVLNEIASTFGGFPVEGTATTVGGLLAALAAAIAWLKRNKADKATTLAGYGITDAAKQTDLDALAAKVDAANAALEEVA